MDVPELVDSRRDDLWLVLPHLGAGGAQKVALIAARHFAAQGLKVKLVTLIPGHPVAHALPEGIPLLELGVPTHRSWWARGGRFVLVQLEKLISWLFLLQLQQLQPCLAVHQVRHLQGQEVQTSSTPLPPLP